MRNRKRGRRSQEAQQRRFVNSVVSRGAHKDLLLKESINVTGIADIYDALARRFGTVISSALTMFHKGEILVDGRGEGSLQREH